MEGADILLVIVVIVSLGLMAGWFLLTACQGGTADSSVVLVEWATESEVDTAGFNIYRSESSDGPFICINDHLIPASPDPLVGGSYVFTDTDVVAGRTYYYQLEDVEFDGTSTRHGPIEAKAAAHGGLWRWWPVGVLLIAATLAGIWYLGYFCRKQSFV